MGALKTIGGILALVGAALALLVALDLLIGPLGIFNYSSIGGSFHAAMTVASGSLNVYIGLILAIIAIVGAILGLTGKKFGGIFALVAGALWLVGGFMWLTMPMITPMSAVFIWTDMFMIGIFPPFVISIEAILCLVGGIFVLAGGSD